MIPGVVSCAYYKISSAAGNELQFSCKGEATGFEVELSAKSLNFGEVQLDSSTNRVVNVVNNSDLPTTFQFISDSSNMFGFSKTQGTVKPNSFTRIIVTFNPNKTGNFYERVFCVVRNHKLLYVDLMGTCFDILTKPVPLVQRHIDAFRSRVIMGTHNKQYPKETSLESKESIMENSVEEQDLTKEIVFEEVTEVSLHKELLQGFASEKRDIHLSHETFDFGFAESGRISESRQLTLNNKFDFPVKIDWALLPVLNHATGKIVRNPFSVTPAECEIPAKGNAVFSVDFAPFESDSYFFQVAQCFVHLLNGRQFKTKKLMASTNAGSKNKTMNKTLLGSMKTSKYLDFTNEDIDPPVCLSVRLCGNSFAPGSQPFIPMIKVSSNKVAFQPCCPGESVYQTVQITNTSDTPVLFKALQDST